MIDITETSQRGKHFAQPLNDEVQKEIPTVVNYLLDGSGNGEDVIEEEHLNLSVLTAPIMMPDNELKEKIK